MRLSDAASVFLPIEVDGPDLLLGKLETLPVFAVIHTRNGMAHVRQQLSQRLQHESMFENLTPADLRRHNCRTDRHR